MWTNKKLWVNILYRENQGSDENVFSNTMIKIYELCVLKLSEHKIYAFKNSKMICCHNMKDISIQITDISNF